MLALILLAPTLGCIAGRASDTPDDFYFVYEIGHVRNGNEPPRDRYWIMLDTKYNVLGIDRRYEDGSTGYTSTEFHMPPQRLRALYDDIIKYDLRAYNSPYLLSNNDASSGVQFYVVLTFQISSEIYTITLDDSVLLETAPDEYRNLQAFCTILMENGYVFDDVPEDFYFLYEIGYPQGWIYPDEFRSIPFDPRIMRPQLDTKNNILGSYYANYTDASTGYKYRGYACTNYYMPPEHLKAIYNYLILYEIKSFSRPKIITGVTGMTPELAMWIRFTFQIDGEVYSVLCDGTVMAGPNYWYSNIWEFGKILGNYLYANEPQSLLHSLVNNPPNPPALDLPPKALPESENHSDLDYIMPYNMCVACHDSYSPHPYPKAPAWIGSYPDALGPWTVTSGSDADHANRTDSAGCLLEGCHARSW